MRGITFTDLLEKKQMKQDALERTFSAYKLQKATLEPFQLNISQPIANSKVSDRPWPYISQVQNNKNLNTIKSLIH